MTKRKRTPEELLAQARFDARQTSLYGDEHVVELLETAPTSILVPDPACVVSDPTARRKDRRLTKELQPTFAHWDRG
jgi:hypothetical protein